VVRLQAFKYELMPDGAQECNIRRFAGAGRFVFNRALALQKARHDHGEKKLGYADLCRRLTEWRNDPETLWLAEAPVHPLQQALKDLERAYSNFFAKRTNFPRFRKRDQSSSFRFPDPKQIKLDQGNGRIFLPKLGWVRYRNSREILGNLRNITISQWGDKWFASIQTQREVEPARPRARTLVGIDLGIARFATMSDGSFVTPLNSFKKHQIRLGRYQRRMARKIKFSNNWKKAKAIVAKINRDIANARKDFLHKTTTTISKNHAVVCIEDLQVRNMSRSATGTVEEWGRNVRAKSGLNRSILDQGWGEFRRQLGYKMQWNGGQLLVVPAHHTSQTCPKCKYISAANRTTQTRFLCIQCGYEDNADIVGANNILERGYRLLACPASGAVMPPATGTHRGDLCSRLAV
jgi:putative transposase